jgi:outer membrane protein W
MKYLKIVISAVFLTSLSVGVASAQESDGSGKYHPFLSTTFQMGLGVYAPTKKNSIGASSSGGNFEESLDSSENETTGLLNFRWRYTDNWSFEANYWKTGSDQKFTLEEDFPFEGDDGEEVVFKAGTSAGSGLDTSITRLFWGRSFNRTASTDWGVGLGLHWMQIDAYVEGTIRVAGLPDEAHREEASVGAPLPNLGIWYMHSWSPKWVVITRLDWLDVTFDQFSGRLLDASVGVNYQMSDHFGVGLAVNAFDLNVTVDGDDGWNGDLETSQYGPRLNLTWNW